MQQPPSCSAGRPFTKVYGVGFSGARLAGRFAWLARLDPPERPGKPLRLVELASLERLCGSAERDASIAYLVRRSRPVRARRSSAWACPTRTTSSPRAGR